MDSSSSSPCMMQLLLPNSVLLVQLLFQFSASLIIYKDDSSEITASNPSFLDHANYLIRNDSVAKHKPRWRKLFCIINKYITSHIKHRWVILFWLWGITPTINNILRTKFRGLENYIRVCLDEDFKFLSFVDCRYYLFMASHLQFILVHESSVKLNK